MKTLTLQQLHAILAHFHNGQSDFKKKLKVSSRPMRRLYKLASNPDNTITESSEVYTFVFELDDYKDHQLTTLRSQLRVALTDFIEIRMLRTSATGQNLIAELYGKFGYYDKANKANKTALQLAPNEAEHKRWLSSFQAHLALHLRGGKGHLIKAKEFLLLFFFVSFLKLTIEELTIFRIKDKEGSIHTETLQQIKQVFKLRLHTKPSIIEIKSKAIEYFVNPSFETYKVFKTIFFNKTELIESDRKFLLNSVLNAIALYPNPCEKIMTEYIPLYKFGIKNTLFNEDGVLEVRTVCNILLASDLHCDYELTELAKEKLIPLLSNANQQRSCSMLAEAYILFGKKEFQAALEKIKQLDKEKTCFDITFRKNILKLKCKYDVSKSSADAYDRISESKRNFDKLLKRNVSNQNIDSSTKICSSNFIKFLMMSSNSNTKKYTKAYLSEKLISYKGLIMESKWLKKKIAERPFWDYIRSFKESYDNAWNKYETLVLLQEKETAFRKMLSRLRKKGIIHENTYKSALNFFNLLKKICDEKNPRNRKMHLLKKLRSYGEFILEKEWIEKKIKKLRP